MPRWRLHGDGGGTRPGRAASVGRCGGGLELGGGWNGTEGRARARRTNGRRRWCSACAGACCGTVARSGVRAGALGRLLWAAGRGMTGWGGPGSSGRRAAARARPEARVCSGGRERASWSERRGAACACGAGRQRRQGRGTCSSGVVMALGRGAAGRQQGSEHGRARSSDAACAEKPGRGRERERVKSES